MLPANSICKWMHLSSDTNLMFALTKRRDAFLKKENVDIFNSI
ncbi:hypothetical protein SLEP1_g52954 [Rubroshorea leprosula]|uniref:Uncharacterized protein n=1 Tax=Rubroshorea leprosula TaxID=152421 RepID=A0AAV5M8U9_9ROSI|nr:hypothetical protein SLEP1_g52954 [Rubroshorea leprosula]